jgi:hypothetical protein
LVALNQYKITHLSMGRGMRPMNLVQVSVHKRIMSAVKRVESVSDRMPYIILRGH